MSTEPNIDLDRERVACVFGLGGGELHVPDERFPDEWDGPGGIAYWYAGPPDYATDLKDAEFIHCPACGGSGPDLDDCDECHGDGAEYRPVRTALLDCVFGFPEAPEGWERIASFSSSGEASCWWCGPGTDWDGSDEQELARIREPVTNTCYRGNPTCKLCEGGGYVYIGDGWHEVVYRHAGATG